jgi:hypothetical protein
MFYLHELWRTHRGRILCLPLALFLVVWASFKPAYWWFAGFIAGTAATYLALLYNGYRRLNRVAFNRPITTTVSDSGLHIATATSTSDVPWASVRAVRQTTDGILLDLRFTKRVVFLPAQAVSQEVSGFIFRKVEDARAERHDGA